MKNKESDTRYPYTYACDFIRSAAPWDERGCTMSRADASQIRQLMSLSLGVDDVKVAERLADTFLNYEPKIYVFKTSDRFEKIDVPENAISFKIVTIAGMKQAHWLQPRSDIEIRDIKSCSECEFMNESRYYGASAWCIHPHAVGIKLSNSDCEIHTDCPIENIKNVSVEHAEGEYVRNVIKYADKEYMRKVSDHTEQ